MAKVIHRTVFTYSRDGRSCTIQHSISATHSESAAQHHQEIVENARPKRPGEWELVRSGGNGGGVDYRGLEATYFARWQRVD